MIAVVAAVVAIIAASVIVVLATRDSSTAGPSGPTDPTTRTSTGPSTSSTGSVTGSTTGSGPGTAASGSSGGQVDPSKCRVDEVDSQGLTPCMRGMAGGLVTGASCTKDAKELGLSKEEVGSFDALNAQWQACFSKDRSTIALLFQPLNPIGRDAIWQAFAGEQMKPTACGNYVGAASRGAFVLGPSTDDRAPMVMWEDTSLPLLGILRPPKADSSLDATKLRSYFETASGLVLDDGDCAKVLADTGVSGAGGSTGPSTATTTTTPRSTTKVNESTVRPDDPTKCVATPLDKNNMSPCLLMLAGNGPALNPTCFTGQSLDQFKDLGDVTPSVVAACTFQPSLMTATVIYLQFSDQEKANRVFDALTKSAKADAWEQAGRRGKAVSALAEDGRSATVTWNFDDMPVVIYALGEGKSGASLEGDSLSMAMDVFWDSLKPTNG